MFLKEHRMWLCVWELWLWTHAFALWWWWFVVFNATFNNISAISTIYPSNIVYYHIFCCNMFVSACPIIAKSQCWLFSLRANTGQISIFALKYPYLLSYIRICPLIQLHGICAVVSKYKRKMMHKDMHKIVFQSN